MLTLPSLKQNIVLAPFTTYQIGGPADWFIEAHTPHDLLAYVQTARKANVPYFILGAGANVLIHDKGVRGLVIHNCAVDFMFLDNNRLQASSGAIIADLIEATKERELSGLEHFVGIPSTVGGAIWQNLHFLSPDRQTTLYIEDIITTATIAHVDGSIQTVDRDFFEFGYDDSILHHEPIIVLDVTFQLTPKTKEAIAAQMASNRAWRTLKQPQLWEYPSCGSVFKKIEGVGAGRLIDQAGLKGQRRGRAEISTKHANYIINLGGATANDVLALIELAQTKVKEKTGHTLELEIRIVGEA